MRTSATSAAATRALARKDAGILAMLGAGVQARSHLEAMRAARPLRQVRGWARTPSRVQRVLTDMQPHPRAPMTACAPAEEGGRGGGGILTGTSGAAPV